MAKILRQGLGYGLVGGVQIVLDWLVFVALTSFGVAPGVANVVGRVMAAVVGFWLNGKWTFAMRDDSSLSIGHFWRFLASWTVMTLLSTLIVVGAANFDGLRTAWVIKPLADLFLAAAGFVVSKYWIYR